jgi:3-deoxy-D-manno-octulosonic-acid transferase
MHCASFGEYEQGLPILQAFKAKNPQAFYLVSFFSPSGYLVKKTHQVADLTTYLPWDNRTDVRRFVKRVQPTKVLFIKYEFWPNLLIELQKRRIPTYLIAGLFQPDQVFFKPWGGWFRRLLKGFTHFFVQNEASQNLLLGIGIKQVSVSGDTRFDRVNLSNEKLAFMAQFVMNRKCIIAGSVWPEDLSVLKESIANTPAGWCWLIAPHEIEGKTVKSLVDDLPAQSQRYSTIDYSALAHAPVLVLDTVGLLSACYQYGQIAYVGGGMGTKGLHNILEPAAAGIPVVIGKNYDRFPEAVELIQQGGVVSISSQHEARKNLLLLMQDNRIQKEKGDINQRFIQANMGATKRVLDKLG